MQGQDEFDELPAAFTGAKDLVMPPYLPNKASGVTLPSRLEVLGNKGFKIEAALNPKDVGNSVLGYGPEWSSIWQCCSSYKFAAPRRQLFLLPRIFSKAMARMYLFVRLLLVLLLVMAAGNISGLHEVHIGRAWVIGTGVSLFVMWSVSGIRWSQLGVMAFCRSLGVPEVEEYMFSYSWKVRPEDIRTLAKACYQAGIAVWIDTVKLCPGDEIRPVIRTVVKNVYRCVVFLTPEYVSSPNCCVEWLEAVKRPDRLVICVLKPLDVSIQHYLHTLAQRGARIVNSMSSLIQLLNREVEDTDDIAAYHWWRAQRISGGGVPSMVAPSSDWSVPTFRLCGPVILPPRSIAVGPAFLAGHAHTTGLSVRIPWLFVLAVVGLGCNFVDIYLKWRYSNDLHTWSDYVWLGLLALCNLAPFLALPKLLETRIFCDPCLRPLLASRAIRGGVKVRVAGDGTSSLVQTLRQFLGLLGHAAACHTSIAASLQLQQQVMHLPPVAPHQPFDPPHQPDSSQRGGAALARPLPHGLHTPLLAHPVEVASDDVKEEPEAASMKRRPLWRAPTSAISRDDESLCVTVYVMTELHDRDVLFPSDQLPFDPRRSVFVWAGKGDPFTQDDIGRRMMRFLCLVAEWEKDSLAESLFSAIGVRVVDCLHA